MQVECERVKWHLEWCKMEKTLWVCESCPVNGLGGDLRDLGYRRRSLGWMWGPDQAGRGQEGSSHKAQGSGEAG